ncbi:MAG: thiamine phosphate synthase, partial [Actinomycetota bacterium]|nr:thiamine phosphate synthase [Actinomycetota bacterium]
KADAVAQACAAADVPFVVNDRVDVAAVLRRRGHDVGVHVGQGDLSPEDTRELVGPDAIVGLSTHTSDEVDAAIDLGGVIDYFAVGPVHETPTKAGRPAAGLTLVSYAAERSAETPWFAIGGIDTNNLAEVRGAGARRVVVLRAIARAADPERAARALAEQLR